MVTKTSTRSSGVVGLAVVCLLCAFCGSALAALNAQICPSPTPSCGAVPSFPSWYQWYQQPGCLHTSTFKAYWRCYARPDAPNYGLAYRPPSYASIITTTSCEYACVKDKDCLAWAFKLGPSSDTERGCWLIKYKSPGPIIPGGGGGILYVNRPGLHRRLLEEDLFPAYECVAVSTKYNGGPQWSSGEIIRSSSTYEVYKSWDNTAPYNNYNKQAPCTDNALKCMALCQKWTIYSTPCTHWTWNSVSKKCFLFSSPTKALTLYSEPVSNKCGLYSGKIVDCSY